MPTCKRRRVALYFLQHDLVEYRGGDAPIAVFKDLKGLLHTLKDACLISSTDKNHRHVGKRRQFVFYLLFVVTGGVGFFVYKIPFIYKNHHTLSLADRQTEDAHILCSNAHRCIYQQHTNVGFVHGTNGANHRVKLQIFVHILFLTNSCCVYQHKLLAIHFVMGMYRIACSSCNVRYYCTFLINKGVEQCRLACIRLAYNGKLRQWVSFFVGFFYNHFVLYVQHYLVQQLAGTRTRDTGQLKVLFKAKRIEFYGIQRSFIIVYFVNDKKYRLGSAA